MKDESKSEKAAPSEIKAATGYVKIGERTPTESRYFRGRTPADHPIFKSGWIIGGQYPGRRAGPAPTPPPPQEPAGEKPPEVKPIGVLWKHEGELSARGDSASFVSFGYFRTKSGLPPEVEAKRAKEAEEAARKAQESKDNDPAIGGSD